MKNKLFQTVLIILILSYAGTLWAGWNEEEQKINFLLEQLGQVDGYFIRNGNDHSPESAVAHMKMKMEKAMNFWFAPDQSKWTVDMFIDKIASQSSFSGKPYQIRFKSGQVVNTGDWLNERLEYFDANESKY